MRRLDWRHGVLGALTLAAIITTRWIPAIPQDPAYHVFADQRAVFGIANFWNIVSNLPFVIVGAFGLSRLAHVHPVTLRPAYLAVCLGTLCIGLGSAYYHTAPTTPTLVWDRLPMSIVFMGLLALILHDRISARLARQMLWPLLGTGVASVVYWYDSELRGQGDLRAYGLIQFLPMLLIPLMLLLYPGKALDTRWLWASVATYALAKLAEHFDTGLYHLTGGLGGHSLKHVLGAVAVLWAIFAAQHTVPRRPRAPPSAGPGGLPSHPRPWQTNPANNSSGL
jgi:hypothetical protein